MNPHEHHPITPLALLRGLWMNRALIWNMTKREVIGRYRGSVIGLGWSFFHPLLMLSVYTFIFSVVFKARWGTSSEGNKIEFALILFAGLIMYNLFSEVINRSPAIILGNPNYVKKVIFPLEILCVVSIGASLFHSLVSLGILLTAFFLFNGFLYWTVLLAPFVILPLLLLTLGFSWMLASLGLYLRDFGHIVGIITMVMMFLTPIFYPLSALPEEYQIIITFNPLTFIVEEARKVLIFGQLFSMKGLFIYTMTSCLIMYVGYIWFQKTRKGFADVL